MILPSGGKLPHRAKTLEMSPRMLRIKEFLEELALLEATSTRRQTPIGKRAASHEAFISTIKRERQHFRISG